MRRPDTLPAVFGAYPVSFVQRVSNQEWSSSCPNCGGAPHQDGEWPDRCRWFTEGKLLGWCRRCGELFWPDAASGQPPDAHEIERWRREQEARELARKRSAERALEHLRSERVWMRYHLQLSDWARQYWVGRGIPREYQDRWSLGWNAHYQCRLPDGRLWDTPSATIPLFDHTGDVLNVKHRLVKAPDQSGKYRYEVAGQPHPPFLANHELPLDGHVIAVEGEIKAAVTYITLADETVRVVGLPGVTPGAHIFEALAQAERVTLVLDPGAEVQGARLVRALGPKRTRLLILPHKIDDIILATGADSRMVRRWLGQADTVRVPYQERISA